MARTRPRSRFLVGHSRLTALLATLGGCLGAPPPLQDAGTTASADTGNEPSTTSTTSIDTGVSTTTQTSQGSTDAGTTNTPDTSTGSTDTPMTGSSTGSVQDPSVVFFDDFDRPDSVALRNGWVEKTAGAWQILDGRVQFESDAAGFADDFFYQPTIDILDVEVSVEFRFSDLAFDDYPQVHGRLDVADTQVQGQVRSYGVFVDVMGSYLCVIRSNSGMAGTNFGMAQLADGFVEGALYRVSIRISGTDPVEVEGLLEREENGEWVPNGSIFIVDDTEGRIISEGAVGTTGNNNIAVLSYDNFMVRDLSL